VVASEDLHCILHFIPLVRKNIEAQLVDVKQQAIMTNFDVLLKDCVEHQNKLYEKILEIVTDTVESVTTTQWTSHPWDNDGVKVPSEAVKGMIKTLKTVVTLLSQFLQTHRVILQKIATKIVSIYYERMKKVMGTTFSIKITTSKGKLRLWDDIVVFRKNVQQWASILSNEVDLLSLEQVYVQVFGEPPLPVANKPPAPAAAQQPPQPQVVPTPAAPAVFPTPVPQPTQQAEPEQQQQQQQPQEKI